MNTNKVTTQTEKNTIQEEQVLEEWEPKVNSFLRNTKVRNLDREDIAQELRMYIIKAWRKWNPEKGVLFHTYLHMAMLNAVRGLIGKETKRGATSSLDALQESTDNKGSDVMTGKNSFALEDESQELAFEDINVIEGLKAAGLDDDEMSFVKLRIKGYKMKDISKMLDTNAARLRNRIRKKINIDDITL